MRKSSRMARILTVTINPVIDKNTSIKKLKPESKLRCSTPGFGPGGGGINVSRALHNLSHPSQAIYTAGGHTGRFLTELMKADGLEVMPFEVNHFTRENLIVFEEETGHQYRFGMPGNEISASETRGLLDFISSQQTDYLVLSGSLLPGMSPSVISDIASLAKAKNWKLIIDTSGEALKQAAETGVYLLKPNLGELASLLGLEHVDEGEVAHLGRAVIKKGYCKLLVISMGDAGALLVSADGAYRAQTPKVETVSTLGAGDSMVAGMVYALSRDMELAEVLRYGVACGTAATMTAGSELCRKEDVEKLLGEAVVEPL